MKLDQHRETARRAALSTERKTHFMKCPKGGADLSRPRTCTGSRSSCPDDNGIWLDAGQLDAVAHEDQGLIDPGLPGRHFRRLPPPRAE